MADVAEVFLSGRSQAVC